MAVLCSWCRYCGHLHDSVQHLEPCRCFTFSKLVSRLTYSARSCRQVVLCLKYCMRQGSRINMCCKWWRPMLLTCDASYCSALRFLVLLVFFVRIYFHECGNYQPVSRALFVKVVHCFSFSEPEWPLKCTRSLFGIVFKCRPKQTIENNLNGSYCCVILCLLALISFD